MRRAQRRTYHYFYKTTYVVTGKYYYGMHSTDNLDDGYIGSGKRLRYSINKYGKENHICEKLEFFETREELVKRETYFVNEDLIKDPMCMNLRVGGKGGFSKENAMKGSFARVQALKCKYKKDKSIYNLFCENVRKSRIGKKMTEKSKKILSIKNSGKNNPMYGKKQSKNSIDKMKNAKSGSNHPSFGTCWIYNIEFKQCKKILKTEIDLYKNWILGRKMKFD